MSNFKWKRSTSIKMTPPRVPQSSAIYEHSNEWSTPPTPPHPQKKIQTGNTLFKKKPFQRGAMMTSSNGNIFRVTGPLCGEFTGPGEFPTQRPVTRSFDVLFDLCLNKRLNKQSWGWWFETPSRLLWRHRNVKMLRGKEISPYGVRQSHSTISL